MHRVEFGAFNVMHNIIVCRVSKGILTRRKSLITKNEGSMPIFREVVCLDYLSMSPKLLH